METKNILLSKTIWGLLIAALPQVPAALEGDPAAITTLVGAVVGIFGRLTARKSLRVKAGAPLLPVVCLLSVCLLSAALCLQSGCSTIRRVVTDRPATAQAVVTFATLKVIKPADVHRAQRVVTIAEFLEQSASAPETATTVAALEALVRAQIDWPKLAETPEDLAMVELLIATVREELIARFGATELSAENRLVVRDVARWIKEAARLRLPPA